MGNLLIVVLVNFFFEIKLKRTGPRLICSRWEGDDIREVIGEIIKRLTPLDNATLIFGGSAMLLMGGYINL